MKTISINLLGFDEKERVRRFSSKSKVDKSVIWVVLFIVGAISLNIVAFIILSNLRDGSLNQKKALEDSIKSLDAKLQELKTLEDKRDGLLKEQKILEYVTGKTFKWSAFLDEFRTLLPENLWINSFRVSDDFTFSFDGTTLDHKSVALFMSNLQNSSFIQTVTLESSEKILKETEEVVNFRINCKINPENK